MNKHKGVTIMNNKRVLAVLKGLALGGASIIMAACSNPAQAEVTSENPERTQLINMLNTNLPDVNINVDNGVAYGDIYEHFGIRLAGPDGSFLNEHLGTLNISATELNAIIQELGVGADILTVLGKSAMDAALGLDQYLLEVVLPRIQAGHAIVAASKFTLYSGL